MNHQSSEAPQKKPLRAICGDCDHVWTVAYLPMELTKAASLMMNAACPQCAGKKVFIAPENAAESSSS